MLLFIFLVGREELILFTKTCHRYLGVIVTQLTQSTRIDVPNAKTREY